MKKKFFLVRLSTINKILVYILTAFFAFSSYSLADENVELEPVIVTSSRIDKDEGKRRIKTRSQDSIVIREIDVLSNFSIPAMLKKSSLTDVRTRGPYGVQADISLRGTPFEESLVLLDGVNLNDPKSGHHNMDLPLTLFDIERVDITYGTASSIYGSGAIGGAVDLVLKKPEDEISFLFSSSAGSCDFYSEGASFNIPMGVLKNRSSVEWKKSRGYARETEFDILTASSHSELAFDRGKLEVFMGYLTKHFGASSFYSNRYPNQEESINTGIIIAKGEIKDGAISIAPSFYWKRLQDKFILDRNIPSFSRNDHTMNLYGGEVSSEVKTDLGRIASGVGVGCEDISSTNLNEHYRIKNSAFIEYENRILNFLVNTSARLEYYSTFGFELSPAFNVGYEIFPSLTVRGGVARAFRAPTFTELYYSTVANKGNPDLKPENAWNYEVGIDYTTPIVNASSTIFLRNTKHIIDWTRESPSSAWQAENIGEFDMYGVEASLKLDIEKLSDKTPLKSAYLKYAYLQGLDKKGVTSKYVLEYLKHNLSAGLRWKLPFGFTEELNFAFRKRIGSEKYFLLDSTIHRDIKLRKGKATFFVKLSNIFNTGYSEGGDIKMPGFAVFGGMDVRF